MYIDVSAVESAVLNPAGMPRGMEDWRHYRLEYGGHAQDCICELVILLPPMFDILKLEDMIREAQE